VTPEAVDGFREKAFSRARQFLCLFGRGVLLHCLPQPFVQGIRIMPTRSRLIHLRNLVATYSRNVPRKRSPIMHYSAFPERRVVEGSAANTPRPKSTENWRARENAFSRKPLDSFRLHAGTRCAAKRALEQIDVELSKLTTKFGENVLDSTNACPSW